MDNGEGGDYKFFNRHNLCKTMTVWVKITVDYAKSGYAFDVQYIPLIKLQSFCFCFLLKVT